MALIRLKICTKIGSRYVYSQSLIEDWELPRILYYIRTIQDIDVFYNLCRAKSFILDGYTVHPVGTECKLQTYKKRVFTGFCTVIYMDRNINYKTYSPFSLIVNGNHEKSLPSYHSAKYEKDLKEALKVLA